MNRARYSIIHDAPRALILKDLDDGAGSLTNDAEAVVADVAAALDGRALYYVDSTGRVDRILVVDGKFAGFAPGWADLESAVRMIDAPPPDAKKAQVSALPPMGLDAVTVSREAEGLSDAEIEMLDAEIQTAPIEIVDGRPYTIADVLNAAHYDGMLTISIDELAVRLEALLELSVLRQMRDEVDAWAERETGFKLSAIIRAERQVDAGNFVSAEEFFDRLTKGTRNAVRRSRHAGDDETRIGAVIMRTNARGLEFLRRVVGRDLADDVDKFSRAAAKPGQSAAEFAEFYRAKESKVAFLQDLLDAVTRATIAHD